MYRLNAVIVCVYRLKVLGVAVIVCVYRLNFLGVAVIVCVYILKDLGVAVIIVWPLCFTPGVHQFGLRLWLLKHASRTSLMSG